MSTSGAAPKGGPPSGGAGGDLNGAYPNPGVAQIRGVPVSAVAPTNGQLFELVGGVWTPSTLVIPARATSVTGPDAFGASAAVGTSSLYSRGDHNHGLPADPSPSPAATVTGPDAFGASAAVGTSLLFARGDHDHGLPANPQRAPATTVTGPDAFGAGAVVGTSLLFARGDHDHGLPANPSAAFAVPAIALGTAAAAGVAASKIRSDATIAAFDATVPVTQAFSDAAATGAAAFAARRDHRHGMPANPAALTSVTSFITASFVLSASTPANVTSVALAAGTWLVFGQVALLATAANASGEIVLATTTASMSPALGGIDFAESALSTSQSGGMFACIVTPGSTTTYFLNVEATNAATVEPAGKFSTSDVFSGIVAVKIA